MWITQFLFYITMNGMLGHEIVSSEVNIKPSPAFINSINIEKTALASNIEAFPALEWCLLGLAGNVSIVKYRERDFVRSLRDNVANLTQSVYDNVIFNGVTFSPEILVNLSLDWRLSHQILNVMNQLATSNDTLFVISDQHFTLLSFTLSSRILTNKPSLPGINYKQIEVFIYISVVILIAIIICSSILFLSCYQCIKNKSIEKSTENLKKSFTKRSVEDIEMSSRYDDPAQLIYSQEFIKKLKESDEYTLLDDIPFLIKSERDFIPLDDNLFPIKGEPDFIPRYLQEEDQNSLCSSRNISEPPLLETTSNNSNQTLYIYTQSDNHYTSSAATSIPKQSPMAELNPKEMLKVERRATSPYRKLSERSCSPLEENNFFPLSSPSPASNVHQSTTSRFTEECNFIVSDSPSPDPVQWSPSIVSSTSTYRGQSPCGEQSPFSRSPYRGLTSSYKSAHRGHSPSYKSTYRRQSSYSLRSLKKSRSRPQSSITTLHYLCSSGGHLSVPSPIHCSSFLNSQPSLILTSRPNSAPLDFDRQLLKPSREKIDKDVEQVFNDLGIKMIDTEQYQLY